MRSDGTIGTPNKWYAPRARMSPASPRERLEQVLTVPNLLSLSRIPLGGVF